MPVVFSYRCRDLDQPYDATKSAEPFPSLEKVWADPRNLFCLTTQTGDTFSQVEINAAELSFTGGSFPGFVSDIPTGVGDLYSQCSRRDAVKLYNLRPENRAGDRITIKAFLMLCPNHPQADQLRAL